MPGDLDLKPFVWTLNVLGLLSSSCNETHGATTHSKIRSVIVLIVAQVTCGSLLIYWVFYGEQFNIKSYNSTGNIYLKLNYVFGCVLVSTIYLHFFACHLFYEKMIDCIIEYQEECLQCRCRGWNLRNWYFLYVFLVVSEVWNNYKAFEYTQLEMGAWTCYQVLCNLVYIICGIVIMLFVAMRKILNCYLHHLNNEFKEILTGSKAKTKCSHLRRLMVKRKGILDFCRNELSDRFGLVLLLIVAFIVFSGPSGPFYFVSVTTKQKFASTSALVTNFIVTLYWNVPWLVLIITVMASSVDEQVRQKLLYNFKQHGNQRLYHGLTVISVLCETCITSNKLHLE